MYMKSSIVTLPFWVSILFIILSQMVESLSIQLMKILTAKQAKIIKKIFPFRDKLLYSLFYPNINNIALQKHIRNQSKENYMYFFRGQLNIEIYCFHSFHLYNNAYFIFIPIQQQMNNSRQLVWISDSTDRRVMSIRALFLRGLEEQSKNIINYYDFLLVAKKLNFRFEESSHLMQLRKYFFNHKNQLLNKKLAGLLSIEEQSLNQIVSQRLPEKIIIRFKVGGEQIESIQEMTNEDEEAQQQEGQDALIPYTQANRFKSEEKEQESQEYREKLTIILSIKVAEMIKKIKILTQGITKIEDQEDYNINIFTTFQSLNLDELPYQIFRKGIVSLLKQLQEEFFRQKLTMSQDDIRAVYSILETENNQKITKERLKVLNNQIDIAKKITKFYQGRINKKMVKNTLFKLGKNSNSIQIYQVKNASVLQFKNIQDGLLEPQKIKERPKPRNPHFGPIKGNSLKHSPSRQTYGVTQHAQSRHNNSSIGTYKREGEQNLQKQREKIERIIRSSKQQKKKIGNDTIANKLRKLFIHKVILPREKLLEQQKMKYLGNKSQSSQIIVKLA